MFLFLLLFDLFLGLSPEGFHRLGNTRTAQIDLQQTESNQHRQEYQSSFTQPLLRSGYVVLDHPDQSDVHVDWQENTQTEIDGNVEKGGREKQGERSENDETLTAPGEKLVGRGAWKTMKETWSKERKATVNGAERKKEGR